MRVLEWLMKMFGRTVEPPTPHYASDVMHDTIYPEAKAAYERSKEKALREQAERVARVQRLGYDVSIITRREHDVAR